MDLDSSSLYLKCFELGKLVLSSGLLHSSWSKISEIHKSTRPNQPSGLGIKIYQEDKYTLVVFDAPPIRENCSLNSAPTLVSVSQVQNPFRFLCSERISSFSLHTPAFKLFDSAYKKLSRLKSELLHELETKKSVIITGAALGGSVASLFTLWLLETIEPKLKRPLCITFGSPLIGDASLQQILDHSVWNSCFLHVADAAAQPPPVTAGFEPFGTFLICFDDSQCICIENPEAVMELLTGVTNTDPLGWRDYGEVLQRLDKSSVADSRLMIDYDGVISRMEERAANKKLRFDQLKKLNDMKISMMYIEWYKKTSKEGNIGYYDRFKNRIASPSDIDVEKRKRELNEYWKSMVEEAEKKPQSEKSNLKTRCLLAGNNFRRMIEPLDIADYYLGGGREYRASGRSRHYVMLENWFEKKEKIKPDRCEKRDLTHFLTFDSCFWADVEDAMIAVNDLKTKVGMRDEALTERLEKFERDVWEMIGKREVSPEIFLEKSSFMKWWREYKEMRERRDGFSNSSASGFTEFMNTRRYETYGRQFAGEK